MRSRFLPVFVLLLIFLFNSNEFCYSKTEPRKLGIKLRAGNYDDLTRFSDGDEAYVKYDNYANQKKYEQFPIALQLNEDLLTDWIYTSYFISFDQTKVENMPPVGPNYKKDPEENYTVDTKTKIDRFSTKFPKFKSKIDSATNPSLSADFNFSMIIFGKYWGVFYPVSTRHRILSLGIGIGAIYREGPYSINLCDPYEVNTDNDGICNKKDKLFSGYLSNFGGSFVAEIYFYSFIGENFEFNFWNQVQYTGESNNLTDNDAPVLKPITNNRYVEVLSVVYAF